MSVSAFKLFIVYLRPTAGFKCQRWWWATDALLIVSLQQGPYSYSTVKIILLPSVPDSHNIVFHKMSCPTTFRTVARVMAEINWFPSQLNNLICRLQIVRTVNRSITKCMHQQSWRNLLTGSQSKKGENVFIDEVALTRSLKVYFKSKNKVVKIVNCLLQVSRLSNRTGADLARSKNPMEPT